MKLSVFGKSMKGNDHQENEDAMLIDRKKSLFVVADGLTNPHGGKLASVNSCKYLQKVFKGDLRDSFLLVNDIIAKERDKKSVGFSTLAATHVENGLIKVCNVGDSPIYIASENRIYRMSASDRVFGTASLSQAIGQETVNPHYSEEKFGVGSYAVISTDGVTDVLSKDEIFEIIKKHKVSKNIVYAILKKANERPTIYQDDKTIIVIQAKEK